MYEYENIHTFYTEKKIKRDHTSHEDIFGEFDDNARHKDRKKMKLKKIF